MKLKTLADGAAIAVEVHGNVVCRGSAGDCAPSIGATLNPDSGLSGLCLRTGEAVRCDDTASDLRVDANIAGLLGVVSILAVPVRDQDQTVGVVEVFSRVPSAFSGKEQEICHRAAVAALDALADEYPQPQLSNCPSLHLAPAAGDGSKSAGLVLDARTVNTQERDHAAVGSRSMGQDDVAVPAARSAIAAAAVVAVLCAAGAGLWHLTNKAAKTPTAAVQSLSAPQLTPFEKLRQVALDGNAAAQYELAMRYLSGAGDDVAQNESEAIAWLLRSAHQGNSSAQYQLGIAYENGTGIQRDLVKAEACFIMAGINGNSASQAAENALLPQLTNEDVAAARTLVAQMYKDGNGTPPNRMIAYVWFTLARAAGSREGKAEMGSLASKLSSAEIAVANQRAAEWLAQHNEAPLKSRD